MARYLVVTNGYPAPGAYYSNAFIHSRVLAYRARGLDVSVVVARAGGWERGTYTFEGVPVEVVDAERYAEIIAEGGFDKLLVHFPQSHMFSAIREQGVTVPVIAWVHGYESEQWHRRWFNLLDDPAAIRKALAQRETSTKPQLEFMRWLFTTTELPVTVVQVSEWFKEHVSEPDVGARARHSVVIPNHIDGDLFGYREKRVEDRLRILSLRPYASRKYANDLTVGAIQLLADAPYFSELSFTLCGDGPLWSDTTAPLRGMANVALRQGLVDQKSIPALHADHGVFLAPTRFDSQGVSMCEAMSSGLVPIGTDISAIGEFVESGVTGLLAPPESAEGLASAIDDLYRNPRTFTSLSRAAAESIRRQCGEAATIERELELIES